MKSQNLGFIFATISSTLGGMTDRNKFYSVSELAREFGITPRTIRFYEDKNLLAPERVGGNRIYDYRDKARLALILRLKDVGFSLAVIENYLGLYDVDETRVTQLKVGYREITKRIHDLETENAKIQENLRKMKELKEEAITLLKQRGVEPERDL